MFIHSAAKQGNEFRIRNTNSSQSYHVKVDGRAEPEIQESFKRGNSHSKETVHSLYDLRLQMLGEQLEKSPHDTGPKVLGPSWKERDAGPGQHLYQNTKSKNFSDGANQILIDTRTRDVMVAFQLPDQNGKPLRQEMRANFDENWTPRSQFSEQLEVDDSQGRWVLMD